MDSRDNNAYNPAAPVTTGLNADSLLADPTMLDRGGIYPNRRMSMHGELTSVYNNAANGKSSPTLVATPLQISAHHFNKGESFCVVQVAPTRSPYVRVKTAAGMKLRVIPELIILGDAARLVAPNV